MPSNQNVIARACENFNKESVHCIKTHLYTLIICILLPLFIMSAPYSGTVVGMQQPDETIVQVKLWGDEYYIHAESPDGYTLVRDRRSGYICYARISGNGNRLEATNVIYRSRTMEEESAASSAAAAVLSKLQPGIKIPAPAARLVISRNQKALGVPAESRKGAMTVSTGHVTGLAILIDFSDDEANIPERTVENYFNEAGFSQWGNNGSVFDFFYETSKGQLSHTNQVTAYYRAPHPKAYYTESAGYSKARELVVDALSYLNKHGYDFSSLTKLNNTVMGLNILYAGYSNSPWAEGLWPHSSGISYTASDGTRFNRYQMTDMQQQLTLGATCHEIGHMLMGWPDLYDYSYQSYGVGAFDLMGYGGSINPRNPVPPGAYCRAQAGWEVATKIELGETHAFSPGKYQSFRYDNPVLSQEYFLIEGHTKTGRYAAIPDHGMMIWHIDQTGSNSHYMNTPQSHYLVALEQADGQMDLETRKNYGDANDLFKNGGADVFHDFSVPSASWWDGSPSGLFIKNIFTGGELFSFSAETSAPGITYEIWSKLPGKNIQNLTGSSFYPENPTTSSAVYDFKSPVNVADHYGCRMHGYLTPTDTTGPYEFWIAGDDNCELWLSTDANPNNSIKIAGVPGWTNPEQWDKYPEQHADSIRLIAGNKYYIKALMKEETGDDHVRVAWKAPGMSVAEIIPGTHLSQYTPAPTYRISGHVTFNAETPESVKIMVTTFNGNLIAQTTTDHRGRFSCSGILAGIYVVDAVKPGCRFEPHRAKITITDADTNGIHFHGMKIGDGQIKQEVWEDIPGLEISHLTGHERYPEHPDRTSKLASFEAPENVADHYGQRIHGLLLPPVDGNYEFWIAGDDHCELWISPDEFPDHRYKIADVPGWTGPREWHKYPQQHSETIPLIGGKRYYICALMKESDGSDHVSVAWQGPGIEQAVIDGEYLSAFTSGYTFSGNVLTSFGIPMEDLTMQLAEGSDIIATTVTDSTGAYQFTGIPYNMRTITLLPTSEVYTFTPASRRYTFLYKDQKKQHFIMTGSSVTVSLSGHIRTTDGEPQPDVALELVKGDNNLETYKTVTDQNGHYIFDSLQPYLYHLKPVKEGYSYTPITRTYPNLDSSKTGQDFTGSPMLETGSIAGLVIKSNGEASTGIAIGLYDAAHQLTATTLTDSAGYYVFSGLTKNIDYEVAPVNTTQLFDPALHTFMSLSHDILDASFTILVGGIQYARWNNIGGPHISDLTSHTGYPSRPDEKRILSEFEAPSNVADNYGCRVYGLLTPTDDGEYYFWIAADDQCELWLSSDNQPENKVKIAGHDGWTYKREWNKYPSQQSAGISLSGGQSYFVEALMKEQWGHDHLAVGWRKPSDGMGHAPVEIVPATYLSPLSGTIMGLPLTLDQYMGWKWVNLPDVYETSDGTVARSEITWTSTQPTVATIDNQGVIYSHQAGTTIITGHYMDLKTPALIVTVKAPVQPLKDEPVDAFLATPAEHAVFEVPIIIIRFLPTLDGQWIDEAYSPAFSCQPEQVADVENRITTYDRRIKYAIEQGSRFRLYKNPEARPSIGYKVVRYVTIYEPLPPGDRLWGYGNNTLMYGPDYEQIFNRLNLQDYVENQGVKEVWLWFAGVDESFHWCYDPAINKPENFRGSSESNMASPVTGDISNSYRIDDLPVYNKSYTVIAHEYRRDQTISMEPHTHQFEAAWLYENNKQDGNNDLFWDRFVGYGKLGRCGWTHTPPNTLINYGYMSWIQHDTSLVQPTLCDIEDWTPDNSGQRTLISYHRWGDRIYDWPDGIQTFEMKEELQWFMYWMQSIPGHQNKIPYGIDTINNWWSFIARWDSCNINNVGLYRQINDPVLDLNSMKHSTDHGSLTVNLQPNPFKEDLTIHCNQPIAAVVVTNLTGQTVLTLSKPGSRTATLRLAHLTKGIYLTHILSENGQTATQKLVKE